MGKSEFLKKNNINEVWWDHYNWTEEVETIQLEGEYWHIVLKTGTHLRREFNKVTIVHEQDRTLNKIPNLNDISNNTQATLKQSSVKAEKSTPMQDSTKSTTQPKQSIKTKEFKPVKFEVLLNYYIDFCQNELDQLQENGDNDTSTLKPIQSFLKRLQWLTHSKVSNNAVVFDYIRHRSYETSFLDKEKIIYPFGCNRSQKKAVETALSRSISVIQGPPGTGKTQTILNIIANLLVSGKTVAMVSNNNSATKNVWEKLSKPNYDLGWLVAQLGSLSNQKAFFDNLPEVSVKQVPPLTEEEQKKIPALNQLVEKYYDVEVEVRQAEKDLRELNQQMELFSKEENSKTGELERSDWYSMIEKKSNGSTHYLGKLQSLIEELAEHPKGFFHAWTKLKLYFNSVRNLSEFEKNLDEKLAIVMLLTARQKNRQLTQLIKEKTEWLNNNCEALDTFVELSKKSLFASISEKFSNLPPTEFNEEDYRYSADFLERFPITTSSSYALTNCANRVKLFDYLIIDEASQVNLPTAFLCMCYARNLVVVGDNQQLPVILSKDALKVPNNIDEAFDASKLSVLESLSGCMPKTILKEHYRCHPDIIEFCNRRFYQNQLVCMTKAPEDQVAFRWIQSGLGSVQYFNGSRLNQKQLQDTRDVLSDLVQHGVDQADIGIIAPYRRHANMLSNLRVDSDTVHRYQGREKNNIIFNSVADRLDDFVDDPHLINVAVSRAKDSFILISPDYEGSTDSNIGSLIRYIRHLDPSKSLIASSRYRSVFEALFRGEAIQTKNKTESPAEALFRELLTSVLSEKKFQTWKFVQEYPLRLLPRSMKLFSDDEVRFMLNGSRLDFLVYDSIDNQPIAVIEVDGASFHKKDSRQAKRDALKDSILKQLGIAELRLRTDTLKGQEEKQLRLLLDKQYARRND